MSPSSVSPYLSAVVPARRGESGLAPFLEVLVRVLEGIGRPFEILIIGPESTVPVGGPTRFVEQDLQGHGSVLNRGLDEARGEWILTIEPSFRHDPAYLPRLLASCQGADAVIASRRVRFGFADVPWSRRVMSSALNAVVRRCLSLVQRDVTSSFRLYRRSALLEARPECAGDEALLEVLVKLEGFGFSIRERPFHERLPSPGAVRAAAGQEWSCLRAVRRLWRMRNAVFSADYDHRAFFSWVLPQRMWQRRRYRVIRDLLGLSPGLVADLGCGTSMIVMGLPTSIALDLQLKKLRYLSRLRMPLVQGSLGDLPLRAEAFDAVVCSQVIEHVPRPLVRFSEMNRILRPGGRLVIGTPDYGTLAWRFTEAVYRVLMPGGYADEHVTHFTRATLTEELQSAGFRVLTHRYVYTGELVILAEKARGPS